MTAMDRLEERLRKVEERMAGRKALGEHASDQRLDCERCGQCLGLRDVPTGTVRIHYSGLRASFVPDASKPFRISCRRCGHDQDCSGP